MWLFVIYILALHHATKESPKMIVMSIKVCLEFDYFSDLLFEDFEYVRPSLYFLACNC